MITSWRRCSNNWGQTWRTGMWAIVILAAWPAGMFLPSEGRAEENFETIPLTPPYLLERFGASIFFTSQGPDASKIITPGKKHLEIDKSNQRLRAYDAQGRQVFEAPVSTGKPGIDAKGRQSSETLSGIHRIVEVKPSKPWSKDPRVKMLNWIGLTPGVEKGIHGLNPVGEFAGYEKFLGQKASHGCIRLSRESSGWLMKWIGKNWKTDPLIVYIYDQPVQTEAASQESRYLLFLIRQEGVYRYQPLSQEKIPTLQKSGNAEGYQMKEGSFLLYKKEAETWHLKRPHLPK